MTQASTDAAGANLDAGVIGGVIQGAVRPSDEARRCAERWQVALHTTPRGGLAGDRLGRSTGASMEFHDRRRYEPGDDVRHVDWRALARTDEVFVRVHREEVSPRLDLFVDVSRSMATSEAKAQRTVDLAAFFALSSRAAGQDVRVVALGARAERIEHDRLLALGLELDADRPLTDVLPEALVHARPRSVRVLVSDFLVPHDPEHVVARLASQAGRVALVQLLSEADADPSALGALRLVDAESGAVRNVVLDRKAISDYRSRLERLTRGLVEESRRVGGVTVTTRADVTLDDALEAMTRDGIVV